MCGISQQGSERRSVESLCLAQDLAQDDTMLLPPAFVTNTASVCFQNLAHSCHRTSPGSPLQSAISGNNARPFASHCHSRALFDRASPSHPKAASGQWSLSHSFFFSSSVLHRWDNEPSHALAFRTPVPPLGLYRPSPQGRGVHSSPEPQINRPVNTLGRCLQMVFLVIGFYGRSVHLRRFNAGVMGGR